MLTTVFAVWRVKAKLYRGAAGSIPQPDASSLWGWARALLRACLTHTSSSSREQRIGMASIGNWLERAG